MQSDRTPLAALAFLATALASCGGSITGGSPDGGGSAGSAGGGAAGGTGGTTGTGGSGGATTTIPCTAMGACECLAAAGRCAPRAEACWCPSECYPGAAIDCICGGGRFLACEDQSLLAACTTALAAVQTKCAGDPFIQYISSVCTSAGNPTCVAGCLADLAATGSCGEIGCGFCTVCDCAPPVTGSPFAACLAACVPAPPPLD